ncbi:MAG TPA: hypothetical protein VEO95_12515 [Chthoniobacteraceae bacterium]|nr:hypothetical protein [Chthoniobacteraceae bacterium]
MLETANPFSNNALTAAKRSPAGNCSAPSPSNKMTWSVGSVSDMGKLLANEFLSRNATLADDREQCAGVNGAMIWNWNGRRDDAGFALHHDMAAALAHDAKAFIFEHATDFVAGENSELRHTPPRTA